MSDLLLFDIDGTLFDPQRFGQFIRSEFVRILNVPEEEIIRVNADYYSKLETTTDFNPRDIVTYVAGAFNVERAALDAVFWENEQIYKESLFEDVEPSLTRLSQAHTLGVFSQGNDELQRRKLKASKIDRYFAQDKIFIHTRKLLDEIIAQIPRGATIIDDNHDVVSKIVTVTDAIWINRRTNDADPNFKTIHSLAELA